MKRVSPIRSGNFFWLALCLALPAMAVNFEGQEFPGQVAEGKRFLGLNGVGLRTATVFKVRVYVAALYAEHTSKKANDLLGGAGLKRVDLVFLREIEADKQKDAWRDSFAKQCGGERCRECQTQIDALVDSMRAVKEGDRLTYLIARDSVEIRRPGEAVLKLSGGALFSELVLGSWIGPHPPTETLKAGMLGAAQ